MTAAPHSDAPHPQSKKAKEKKYTFLSANFLRGSFGGQLTSVHKDRANAQKVAEFKAALQAKEVVFPDSITRQQETKLNELEIKIPHEVQIGRQTADAQAA